jgi:carbamoyl-phosphate synthase large subunit
MAKIYVGGAGGAPSNNFIRSLRDADNDYYLIGACSVPSDLFLAQTDEKYVLPPGTHKNYKAALLWLLRQTKPDFIHVQNDFEVRALSRIRSDVEAAGVKHFLPSVETIENCVDKMKSYAIWKKAGVPVAETRLIHNEQGLREAFEELGPRVWVRAIEGGGGTGALPTDNVLFAKLWIDRFNGWGHFTASACLTERTVTWLSLWHEGELIVAQTRRRRSWKFGSRTLSGVTGITGVGETCSDPDVDRVAQSAIAAMDSKPHGLFGVDMTYDEAGLPNVTEINIGRFFTTQYFFTVAGLNIPDMYCQIALNNVFPELEKKVNPLPDGLVWIRGMDSEPILITAAELDELERFKF